MPLGCGPIGDRHMSFVVSEGVGERRPMPASEPYLNVTRSETFVLSPAAMRSSMSKVGLA